MNSLSDALNVVLKSVESMGKGFLEQLPNIIIAVVVLFIFWIIARVARKVLNSFFKRINLRDSLVELFRKIVVILIWVFGIMVAATIVFPNFTPAKILTVVGLSSIAIGFAFKDVFENFLAGILILLREPFQLGDFIQCEEMEGFVEEITIRDTNLRRTDGQRIVVPNAMLFTNPVKVRTDKDIRRITVVCGVAYDENVDECREIIKKTVEGLNTVNKNKEVEIFAQEFGASSINFEITWWTGSSPLEIRKSRDEVVAGVKRALDDAGIEIPFPYRTLTFKEPLKTISQNSENNESKTKDSNKGNNENNSY